MVDAGEPGSLRGWRLGLIALLAAVLLAGAGICLYLTWFHEVELYGDRSATLVNCPITETVNCEAVNTSPYAEILGTPISSLGIPTYLLLLGLAVMGRRRPRLLSYAFGIALLTVFYSGFLYYISSTKIGLLCAWCMRLYAINLGVTILTGLAAWRNPLGLLGEALGDLLRFPRELRVTAAAMAALLVFTVAGDRLYRATLTASPTTNEASSPAAPATPSATGAEAGGAHPGAPLSGARPMAAAPPVPLVVPGPLKRVSGQGGKIAVTSFDLKSRIGKGRPVALIFFVPGYALADAGLVEFARYLKEQAPQVDVYAIAGRREDQRIEMIWESFCLLNVPADLPLLLDEDYVFSKQADAMDVPDLVLVNGRGEVVASKLKGLNETVPTASGMSTAQEVIRQVAGGGAPQAAANLPAYFPATGLYGACAPTFSLPEFPGGKKIAFDGISKNGKPTFLMFWSSTCKHCQKEIPLLLQYVRAHPGEFNMVSVAIIKADRADGFSHRKVTEEYIKINDIPWTVLDDSSGYAADLYRIVSTPTTFLISPGGEIVDAWYYPHQNLEMVIPKVLSRLQTTTGACVPRPQDPIRRASFSVAAPEGGRVQLDSLAERPSILHLWATWCVPCQSELPGLLKYRKTLEKEGGKLLLVSVEDAGSLDRVRKFGSRFESGFSSFLAPQGGLADRVDLSYTVPRTYLMSKGGTVIRELYGVQQWDDVHFQKDVAALLQLPGS
jgi:thiol-disulfide isomerase/thioredoxin/uncharacterized membrane protein